MLDSVSHWISGVFGNTWEGTKSSKLLLSLLPNTSFSGKILVQNNFISQVWWHVLPWHMAYSY